MEVQRLTGRMAALNWFLSRSAVIGYPFFLLLRKDGTFEWTRDLDQAFVDLKIHLQTLPILISPTFEEPLYLYLSTIDVAVSAVLVAN